MGIIRQIRQGIRNLLYWLPIIWRDRDWDYYYLYSILRHKLLSMERFERHDALNIDRKRIANDMQHAVYLVDRLIAENYLHDALEVHRKKYGDGEWILIPLDNEWTLWDGVRYSDDSDRQAKAEKEFEQACDNASKAELRDINELFLHLARHIKEWWD